MDKPYEFEDPHPKPPNAPEPPSTTPWIDHGTIYVPINMNIDGAEPETGIFLPSNYRCTMGTINLIVYFHGNKDPNKKDLGKPIRVIWKHQAYPFRKLVEQSGANYVLVCPTLGDVGGLGQGDFATRDGAIRFIDEVCQALFDYGPCGSNSTVGQLILAAHSGGGYYLKKVLPFYEAEYGVDQVWAFDCLYDTTTPVCSPSPYRICKTANKEWPQIPHNHSTDQDVNGWKSSIQGTVEQTLANWARKGKPLRAYWNSGSGTAIRTANLALLAKLNSLSNVTVTPDLYTGFGADARPVKPPVRTSPHDDIPRLKMPECLQTL